MGGGAWSCCGKEKEKEFQEKMVKTHALKDEDREYSPKW